MSERGSKDYYNLKLIGNESNGLQTTGLQQTKPCGLSVINDNLSIIKHYLVRLGYHEVR